MATNVKLLDENGGNYANVNSDGAVLVSVSGSFAEKASAQDTQVATTAKMYDRADGATQMEVYCESGSIRVRTDGIACTATTGQPIGMGYMESYTVASLSIYYVEGSTVTVVSR